MEKKVCKYCGKEMSKVLMPPESDWGVEYFLVCMNDECPYYIRGWDWMASKFKVKASYRYKYNTFNDDEGPIPVMTPDDYKSWVVHQFNK